jgi:predicted transcriptional regulator
MKRRRDATGIIHEIILLLSRKEITKTQIIYETNTNSRLMSRYLEFLTGQGYLAGGFTDRAGRLKVTAKGRRLLSLLNDLEEELKPFRESTVRDTHKSPSHNQPELG